MTLLDRNEISANDPLGDFQASHRPLWDDSFDQWHPNPPGHEFSAEGLRVIVDGRAAAVPPP